MPDSTMPSDPGTTSMRKEAGFFSYKVDKDYNSWPNFVNQVMDINTFENNLDHRGTPSMTGSRSTDDRKGRQNRNRGSS